MQGESSQSLLPGEVYELLGDAKLASDTTLARASALAEKHPDRTSRRLIAVAVNQGRWIMRPEEPEKQHHPFFDDVLFGIRARADRGNVDLLLLTGTSSQVSGEATHYLDLCRRHGAEGIILGAFAPDEPELASIAASAFPCVAIDTQLIGPCAGFVTSDNISGAAAAVRHLAERGRKRIAYLGGWGSEPVQIDRRLGYESELGELGLAQREEYVLRGGWLHERAHDLTRDLLQLAEPPDAIFCASDVMAIGAMLAIEQAGLTVPDDIALVGFDDTDYARMSAPSLTSVRQDPVGLGTAAVEAILRILDSPDSPPPSSILPTELIVRESTAGRSSANGTDLQQALSEADERVESPSDSTRRESEPRLSAAALCRLLGRIPDLPPKTLTETYSDVVKQEWRPEKRRLIALAIDSAPDQSFRHAFFDELSWELRALAYLEDLDLLLITNIGTTPGAPFPPFLELCDKYGVDGLVVVSLPLEEPPVAALAASDFPCVTLDVDLLSDRIAFVMSDNVGGAVSLTRHLIESGRQKIAFIGGRGDERPTVDRRFGYRTELARWNLPCPEEYVAMANWIPTRAYEATQAFLALPEPPDAIFCASDVMAIGAMAAIEDAGLKIPNDIAVVGFDDIDYARLVEPALTTVRQRQDALAESLITAMLDLLDHPQEPPTVSVIPVELIVRESSVSEQGAHSG